MRTIPIRAVIGVGLLLTTLWGLAGCRPRATNDGKLHIVASFFPLAEAARHVGGTEVTVENLTQAGAEPHDLELTPSQAGDLQDASAVLVMGHDFQPSVERAAARNHHRLALLDRLPIASHPGDPHAWLDPSQMTAIVNEVAELLASIDRSHATRYRDNAARYRIDLDNLDTRYRNGLASCARRDVVTSHDAFGWMAARYGLAQLAITGLNPESEPTADKLGQLADLVRRRHITTVFTETLVSPRAADALAREAGVHTDVLNPIEGLTKAQQTAGASYVSLMDSNLGKLRSALGCA